MDKVEAVPSVTTTLEPEDAFKVSPFLTVSWNPDVVKITPDQVAKDLFDGEPRIRMVTTADGLGLGPREKEIRDSGARYPTA